MARVHAGSVTDPPRGTHSRPTCGVPLRSASSWGQRVVYPRPAPGQALFASPQSNPDVLSADHLCTHWGVRGSSVVPLGA
ncbi:MAG: hypothetical protein HRU01_14020 [Myxococcales bacterium]|nr:hypothetical protein [Myxococcales bacterium]